MSFRNVGEDNSSDDGSESNSNTMRENRELLDRFNRLRAKNYKQLERNQSFAFANRKNMSVLLKSGQVPQTLDATGRLNKEEEYKGMDEDDESENMRGKHVQSVIAQEDSFFFKQNKVLERDILTRLGQKTATKMTKETSKDPYY